MFERIGYLPFIPRASSEDEALQIAEETLGTADAPVIAFHVVNARPPSAGQ